MSDFTSGDARRQQLKTRLSFTILTAVAVLLFVGVVGAAVWRAFSGDEYPPTPTIPVDVEQNFAYVSDVVGTATSHLPGVEVGVPLERGTSVGAGRGALIRVADNGWVRLGFNTGDTLFLDGNTEIELRQVANEEADVMQTVVLLNQGQILGVAKNDAIDLVIRVITEAQAETTTGVLGATYAPDVQRFGAHCLQGSCRLVERSGDRLRLQQGQYSEIQGYSPPSSVGPAHYEIFRSLGDPGLIPTATPIPRGARSTATPEDIGPTPSPVSLEPTATLPTFTPRPSPTQRVFPTTTPAPGDVSSRPGPTRMIQFAEGPNVGPGSVAD